ncbi:hypothetical protein [uncultured Leifsonia sp.]|uniref:hypothetical protein n=1 Tax=uncultured Leifsonia sp. TaxID=340359 RepID=UPI0028D17887|nr:hypothetical protein [uncultured Leifsonia sp.]
MTTLSLQERITFLDSVIWSKFRELAVVFEVNPSAGTLVVGDPHGDPKHRLDVDFSIKRAAVEWDDLVREARGVSLDMWKGVDREDESAVVVALLVECLFSAALETGPGCSHLVYGLCNFNIVVEPGSRVYPTSQSKWGKDVPWMSLERFTSEDFWFRDPPPKTL